VTIPNGLGSITLTVVSNTLTTYGNIVNNNTTVFKNGNGTWAMTGPSTSAQSLGLIVTAGQVLLDKQGGQAITGGNNVGLTVEANALVQDEFNNQIHSDSAVPLPVNLSGGVWDLNGWNENVDLLSISAGGTLRVGSNALSNGGGSTSTLDLISGYTASLTGTNCQFDVQQGEILNFKGAIGGSGSLVTIGAGTLNLEGTNVYTGSTIISNGTLALPGVSSISDTAGIDLLSIDSALDLSGNTDTNGNPTPVLTLQSGQILSGIGVVTGLVVSLPGTVVAPGSASSVGTLTVTGVSGANTLNGTILMKLNKAGATNDQLSVSGSLVYGGTLALTNLSGSLAPGDSFTLFPAAAGYSGTFASINPSRPGYPGFGLAWNTNNLAVNGTLSIVAASIPPSPKITSSSLSGTTLLIHGSNGLANEPFVLLASTNVAATLPNWMPVLSNSFDGSGNFSVSIGVTNAAQEFFVIWTK
jgi:autotransporter-associated beta strand protein